MIDQFQAYINRYNLLAKGDKLILAISGGIDSMVLADMLLKAKVEFVAAHCNFHLRGVESDGDEKFVRDYAERNGIQCFVKHFDTEKYAAEQGISIEMAARDLRYSWFEELRQQLNYDKIAVAHHADDQAETFFINLLRGAGLNGLKGMKPQNGVIIRPLLWASREQIRQYAVESQIVWREDHTNAESVYLRNKIRNQLLPTFDELQPEARQGLYKSLEHLFAENELYRDLLKEKLAQIVELDGDVQRLPYSKIIKAEVPEPVEGPTSSFQLLFEWLRQFGFNTDQCHFIYDAIGTGVGNQYCSATHRLVIGRYELQLYEIKEKKDDEIQIGIGEEEILSPFHLCFSKLERIADFIIDKSPEVAQLDYNKLSFPLTLRHWLYGDRFHPLGMKGSKLLSDFFVDQKFTEYQKQNVWLLVSADGDILWVVGCRLDDRFKITDDTKTVFECRWNRP
ncbi:MAG: tRNA lysidine(34) synthetase TilS [Bacteroidales bacterium]|nr:tRNA lysidine(34) synthetase TilS [Bacteroidales bacterium]MBR6227076.1 tRNA lysidine(34) synthetase TilS [Bacteroidales bacterium]